MKRLFFYALMGFLGSFAAAATVELPMLSQYVHRQWTMVQGLPQNSITDILQDEEGFLWLATQEGLVRFDGYLFKVDNDLVEDQNYADVRALHLGKDQKLWLSLYRGIAFRDLEGNIQYGNNDSDLLKAKIRAIGQDGVGGLWLGALDGTLYRLKGSQARKFQFPGLADISCLESYRETLWIGTQGNGLFVFEKGLFQKYDQAEGLLNNHINALQLDHRGVLWIGTNNGIYSLSKGKLSLAYGSEETLQWNRVTALLEGAGDLFWAGTQSGLMRLRRERGKLYREDTIEIGEVTTLFEDQQGYLWVGTQGNGLHQFRTGTFKTVSHKQGLPHNSTWAIYATEGDTVFAATEAYGMTLIQNDQASVITEPESLDDKDIASLAEDGEGGLWIGGYDGLYHWREGAPLTEIAVGSSEDKYVYPVYRDRDDRLLFGTFEGLYVLYPGETKPIPFLIHRALNAEFLNGIVEDDLGRLWFATSEGLFSYWQDTLKQFNPDNSQLKTASIMGLHVDRENRLWLAYEGGGLALLDDGTFRNLTSENGLWEPEIYSIIDDGVGSLWMASNNGIFKAGKRELMDAFQQGVPLSDYRHFTEQHGLTTRECNFGGFPSAVRDGNGRLWFATLGGVAVVDPNKTKTFFKEPKLYIDHVTVDGKTLTISGNEWLLPETFQELAIYYSALDLVAAQSLRFRTRLEGMSETWVPSGQQRVAYFSQLPPGRFRFHVALEGNPDVAPITMRLKRQASFWAYPLFIHSLPFIVLIFVVAFLIWALNERRSQLLGMDYSLGRKAQEIKYIQDKVFQTEEEIGRHLNTLSHGENSTAKLHNIGNVMNSFSVSASLIEKTLRSTDLHRTTKKVIDLFVEQADQLGRFVSEDPRGLKVVNALDDLNEMHESNNDDLLHEVANLHMQCGHLKDILQGANSQSKKSSEVADFNILVEDAVKIQSHAIRKFGIEVIQELEPLPSVKLPKSELLQILVNLIKNAYEAIRMNDEDNPQRLRLRTFSQADGEQVVLEVHDTGVGITKEHQERLFSHGFTTKPDGHGFGLHYCKSVIEQMGGVIEARSEGYGRGAVFILSLPITEPRLADETSHEQGVSL